MSDTVAQHVCVVDEDRKFPKLLELLGHFQERGSILVFVEKQAKCDVILKDLMSVGCVKRQCFFLIFCSPVGQSHSRAFHLFRYPCLSLHGGIDQSDRDSNIHDFKMGNIPLLIATSVAARGLDVKSLNLVVNYDVPSHYEVCLRDFQAKFHSTC